MKESQVFFSVFRSGYKDSKHSGSMNVPQLLQHGEPATRVLRFLLGPRSQC